MLKVSVIIPTYNRAKLLKRALISVAAQTFLDYEIIVVDDGSEDETAQAIAKIGIDVRYVCIKHSGLAAVARNKGIGVASGDYIAFLDSDDQWLPQKLATQVPYLEDNPAVGLVCSNGVIASEEKLNAEAPTYLLGRGQAASGKVFDALLKDNFVITSSVVVRREVLDQVGGFDERATLHYSEDYELWLRIAARFALCYVEQPLVVHLDHGASLSGELGSWRKWACIKSVLTKQQVWYPAKALLVKEALLGYAERVYKMAMLAGHARSARRLAVELVKFEPVRLKGYGYWAATWVPPRMNVYLYRRLQRLTRSLKKLIK